MDDSPSAATLEPTQDERTMATLAHALQVVGSWIAPLIIFLVKRQSRFVSFHALQALLLQLLHMLFIFTLMAIFFISMFTTLAHQIPEKTNVPPPALFVLFPIMWLGFAGAYVLILTLAIVYAIKAGRGEWADYPLLGTLTRKILRITRAR
jgi:uncharacterized membrane protein